MHGDFEAQRHWMEITTQLPISHWYFYDLQYWGLDYPPLTAYHSWLLGKMYEAFWFCSSQREKLIMLTFISSGSFIRPEWFAFATSRGIEDQLLKVYMRATVIVSEYLVYIPATVFITRRLTSLQGVNPWEGSIALVAILMQPATMLVDHAHFQYNTVMLGLVTASTSSILAGRLLWGCVFFVAALCFKQMALYFAPAIFAYLMGVCLLPKPNILRFVAIATVTLLSFAITFAPLLLGSLYEYLQNPTITADLKPPHFLSMLPFNLDRTSWAYQVTLQLSQSIHRIFPFARGIFEDKVANFWGCLHTAHKLNSYPIPLLQRFSLSLTLLSILPACMTISLFPRKELLPWAMASSAWGFFLFSFQVHEKSVLLPLLPMTVLLAGATGLGPETRGWVGWANILGTWTLFPLLKRDELRVPYAVLTILWTYLLGLPPTSMSLYQPKQAYLSSGTKLLHLSFYAAMLIWHGLEAFVAPPAGKPDLWVVINVLIGAAGFAICYLWSTWQLILRGGVLEDYFGVRIRLQKLSDRKPQGRPRTSKPQR